MCALVHETSMNHILYTAITYSSLLLQMWCVKWKYNLGHHSEGAAHLWLTPKQHFKDYRFMHRGGPSASTCDRVTSWQVGMNNVTVHYTFDSWNHECIINMKYIFRLDWQFLWVTRHVREVGTNVVASASGSSSWGSDTSVEIINKEENKQVHIR